MIAEYERAKFLERSRRGKCHAAQAGRVGILCHAPYGYRYVSKQEGGGEARYEIVFDEARVVQQVYTWVGEGPFRTLLANPTASGKKGKGGKIGGKVSRWVRKTPC